MGTRKRAFQPNEIAHFLHGANDERTSVPAFLFHGLDFDAFEALCKSARATPNQLKFAEFGVHIARAWKDAQRLGLDRAQSLEVLDLGTGPGYFLYVCQRLGHRVLGLDRANLQFWSQLVEWLGLPPIVEQTIAPLDPLPELNRRFDLVTAFAAPFNYLPKEQRLWTIEEWIFFLDDLRDHILKPRGRFALQLRLRYGHVEQTEAYRAQFNELCEERGALQYGPLLLFDPLR